MPGEPEDEPWRGWASLWGNDKCVFLNDIDPNDVLPLPFLLG